MENKYNKGEYKRKKRKIEIKENLNQSWVIKKEI